MKYLVLLSIVLVSSLAKADRFEFTGEVLDMLTSENVNNQESDALFLFYVDNFKSAGQCYVANSNGHLTLRVRNNDQGKLQSSMVLAAFMSGKKVFVRIDESHRDSNNFCYVQQIRLNKNF